MSRLPLALVMLLTLACRSAPAPTPRAAVLPRNLVLLVGDGMGPAHFTAARLLRGEGFAAGRFPVTGLVSTRSANALVTDSGAAATALASGVKADNRSLGLAPGGARLESLLERAAASGKATGLVTTAAFWDATPAAFAVHTPSRDDAPAVVAQLLASPVTLIAGAGAEQFGKAGLPELAAAARTHGRVLVDAPGGLAGAPAGRVLVALPSQPSDAEAPGAPLHHLARWALQLLAKDPDGFILVVEHEGTDRASHENAAPALEASLRAFDAAVGAVADVARARGDTLVLVLGDHETGALRVEDGPDGAPRLAFASTGHTATLVPLFALGPGAERFAGLHENSEVGRRLQALLAPGP